MITTLLTFALLMGWPGFVAPVFLADVSLDTLQAASEAPPASRPDIVLILTDDQPYHTLQYMPHTSALLTNQGVEFSNAFSSMPLCCPSRATALSGQYAHNHGVTTNGGLFGGTNFDDSSTVATRLLAAGYRTGFIGKYFNSYADHRPWPYVPPGWAVWKAFVKKGCYYNCQMVENGAFTTYRRAPLNYSTTLLARQSVGFIQSTPAGTPLFLLVAPYSPHDPPAPAPGFEGSARSLSAWQPPSFNETDVSDKPEWVRSQPPLSADSAAALKTFYQRVVESLQGVDRAVADIVGALEAAGRLENAILIFTSDNGFSLGEQRWVGKQCVYEACVRVPLVVRAPGVTRRTDPSLISNVDLAPTVLDFAGLGVPPEMDGRSVRPLLYDPTAAWRSDLLLEILGGIYDVYRDKPKFRKLHAIRTERFVYAELFSREKELYDLLADPWQLRNLAADSAYAAVRKDLRARLAALKAE